MRFVALALLAIGYCLLCNRQASGLEIPADCFTKNVGTRCTWAAIQTIAKARKLGKLETVLERRIKVYPKYDDGATDKVEAQLTADGAEFVSEPYGTNNVETLAKYANTHGVVVTMRAGTNWIRSANSRGWPQLRTAHSIAVVGWDGKNVRYFCSDNPQQIWESPREWFEKGWQGDAVVILGGERQPDTVAVSSPPANASPAERPWMR